jgi:hypothetical protein
MKAILIILVAVFALTGSVDISYSIPNIWGVWDWGYTESVHVVVSPGGGGTPLTSAEFFGRITTDATILVQLWYQDDNPPEDPPPPAPVPNYPGEDIWLEIPGAFSCLGGATADGPTDSEGWFTFSLPLFMGGWNEPGGGLPLVFVNGGALFDQDGAPISPTIVVNSPDINADLLVNLTDLALFSIDFHGSYSFRSDFIWDGVINLSDVVWMAVLMGDECP